MMMITGVRQALCESVNIYLNCMYVRGSTVIFTGLLACFHAITFERSSFRKKNYFYILCT